MTHFPWRFILPVPFLAWGFMSLAAPGIIAGDAGELTAAAFTLGPAHPPGYPLYVLLGRLAVLLPVGTPAFRLTLFSCLALAFSYPLIVSALERFLQGSDPKPSWERPWIAGTTALFVLTGPLVLSQAQGPEVYALHFLLCACLFFLLTRAKASWIPLFFVLGAALAHHHLVLLAVPALVVARWGSPLRPKDVAWGLAFLVLGLSLYLVLPLRAALDPAANWSDPDRSLRFFRHVSRFQYGGALTEAPLLYGWENLLHYLRQALGETAWLGAGLALLAVGRKRSAPYVLSAAAVLLLLPLLLRVEKDPSPYAVIDAYLPPAFLWLSPILAAGTMVLLARVTPTARRLLIAVLITLVAVRGGTAWKSVEAGRNLVADRSARNCLLAIPGGGALYSRGDTSSFALFHLKTVTGLRPDAFVTDRSGGTFGDPYGFKQGIPRDFFGTLTSLERIWDQKNPERSSFYTERRGAPGRRLEPFAQLYLADRDPDPRLEAEVWRRCREPEASSQDEFFTRSEAGNYHVFRAWWRLRNGDDEGARKEFAVARGLAGLDSHLMVFQAGLCLQRGWRAEAADLYSSVLGFAPRDVTALYRSGLMAREDGRTDVAERFFLKALRLYPRRTDVRNSLAVLMLDTGRTSEAVLHLERILREDPNDPDAVKNLALALWGTDRSRSRELLERYLRLVPAASDRKAVEAALR